VDREGLSWGGEVFATARTKLRCFSPENAVSLFEQDSHFCEKQAPILGVFSLGKPGNAILKLALYVGEVAGHS
jgi:hypothetical protein